MLVLESNPATNLSVTTSSPAMLTPGASQQYIQPDYLSPLPTTLDTKRSPLALLAQTCSQIGADPPLPAGSKASDKSSSSSSGSKHKESSESSGKSSKTPPATKHESRRMEEKAEESSVKSGFKSPGVHSSSSNSSSGKSGHHHSHHHHSHHAHSTSPTSSAHTSTATSAATESTRTSVTDSAKLTEGHRAALDALQGLPKDIPLGTYRPHGGVFPPLSGLSPYPGLDAATAAALGLNQFRHPYPPLGGIPGYPPVSLGLSLAGYQALNYGRMKNSGSDSLMAGMPVCRDPYCTGCPSSVMAMAAASPGSLSASSATAGSVCPAGCTQCDHQKLSLPSSGHSTAPTSTPTSTTSSSSPFSPSAGSAASANPSARPYVCNWIAGDNYCGKRFTSSEELLQHLRTHTSLSVPAAESASSGSYASLLNPNLHPHSHLLASSSALHRTYPTPPLSPLSMARYHPYSKASAALPSPLGHSGLGGSSAPNPLGNPLLSLSAAASQNQLAALGAAAGGGLNPLASLGHNHLSAYAAAAAAAAGANPLAGHPGLSAYYSHPYSLYSQRLGAGVLP